MNLGRALLAGAVAGAAGTTALNAVTYLDMAVRGRPASSVPETAVTKLSEKAGVPIPGDEETRGNRLSGLGPLTGLLTGISVGVVLGVARAAGWRPGQALGTVAAGAGAMAGTDGPMTALGVTQPRTWSAADWVSDAIPHLAYGAVTAYALERLDS